MNKKQDESSFDGIAIIGMGGRFPGADNIHEFWRNLRDGKEAIKFFSDEDLRASELDFESIKDDPNYVPACGVLENADLFDARFFGFSPRDATFLDPQQRIWLECAWEALENAGYDPDRYKGSIGVFAGGSFLGSYLLHNLCQNREYIEKLLRIQSSDTFSIILSNSIGSMPTRTSHKFNLKGPSINVQTACSTSLVAVCLACQSLLNYDSDVCLAGGTSIIFPQERGYLFEEGGIFSPDGHCRPFDAKASGTLAGNGVGVIVLKRLEDSLADRDKILAVIRGTALNNDGSQKVSYYAPSVEGQAKVIAMAQAVAEVDPETITYIETHGTATPLGDPVEISGLTKAFRLKTDSLQFCGIGSLKSNIGHLDAAAGVAGLIKTVLALQHKEIPPSLHYENPNPEIDFENSPFYVVSKLTKWKTAKLPRRAGVSSFGIGGTNAHVVLEEAPVVKSSSVSKPHHLIMLSAKTDTALANRTKQLAKYLKANPNVKLADVAFTLQVGRQDMNQRQFIVCRDLAHAVKKLDSLDPRRIFKRKTDTSDPPIVFMFPGQASQYVNMGLELYKTESRFREQVDLCSQILQPHLSLDLRDILYPDETNIEEAAERLKQTFITQPALFIIEYALAKLWMSWGVYPEALVGHNVGEYVAACLAGVFSLEDALSVVAARGRLIQDLPGGSMLTVYLSEKEIQPFLGKNLSLAAINGPSICTISGDDEAIEYLEYHISKKRGHCKRLNTSHAFHSNMMVPIVEKFTEHIKQVRLHPPQIPFVSNITGTWITSNEAMNPAYWAKHLCRTVRFSDCVEELSKDSNRVFLEVGPGQTLSTLVRHHPNKSRGQIMLSSMRHPAEQESDIAFILNTLGKLWFAGVEVDWSGFYAAEKRNRVSLPTYPFERQRYWVEPVQKGLCAPASQEVFTNVEGKCQRLTRSELKCDSPATRNAELNSDYIVPRKQIERSISYIWEELLGIEKVGIFESFFELGGDSLVGARVITRIRKAFGVKLFISDLFEAPNISELAFLVESRADNPIDFSNSPNKKDKLLDELKLLGSI